MGPFLFCHALNDGPILLIINSVPLRAYGPICILSHSERWAHYSQLYILFPSKRMGPFIYHHALNDGPMLSMIYCVMFRAYGPIHITLRTERWAHTLNHIFCSAQSIWAYLYYVTLWTMGRCSQWYIVLRSERMGPFILNYAMNNRPILSIIYSVTLRAHGPIIMNLHSKHICPSTEI